MKVIVLLVSILTLSQISVFCQQSSHRVCDTIRYEFVEGKIIIPVIVNGLKVKYIVDTGGQTGTDWEHILWIPGGKRERCEILLLI